MGEVTGGFHQATDGDLWGFKSAKSLFGLWDELVFVQVLQLFLLHFPTQNFGNLIRQARFNAVEGFLNQNPFLRYTWRLWYV